MRHLKPDLDVFIPVTDGLTKEDIVIFKRHYQEHCNVRLSCFPFFCFFSNCSRLLTVEFNFFKLFVEFIIGCYLIPTGTSRMDVASVLQRREKFQGIGSPE